jgi:hypothetical protein
MPLTPELAAIAQALRADAPATVRLLAAYELATGQTCAADVQKTLRISRSAYYRNYPAAADLVAATRPTPVRHLTLVAGQSHQRDSQSHQWDADSAPRPRALESSTGYPQEPPTYPQGYAQSYPQADRPPASVRNIVPAHLRPGDPSYPQHRSRRRINKQTPEGADQATACREPPSSSASSSFSNLSEDPVTNVLGLLRSDFAAECPTARLALCLLHAEAAQGLRIAVETYGAATVRAVHRFTLRQAAADKIPEAFYAKIFCGAGFNARYSAYLKGRTQLRFDLSDHERDIMDTLEGQ